jgi:hypothetical protein
MPMMLHLDGGFRLSEVGRGDGNRDSPSLGSTGVCRAMLCTLRSDDTDAPSGVACGRLAVGSALCVASRRELIPV